MPKMKTSRVTYPDGWELIEPTLRELQNKMREAENESHEGKRKYETLWPIFKIAHQKSRYMFDLYYKREEISKELYEFCLDQGYADRNLIAKWKKATEPVISVSYRRRISKFMKIYSYGSLSTVDLGMLLANQQKRPFTNECIRVTVYIPQAWIRAAMLLKMHPATGSQLPNNMRLQSAQAPERGESHRVHSLRLPRLC
ncbi:BUD31 homolog 1-like protein [Drosera capensis]